MGLAFTIEWRLVSFGSGFVQLRFIETRGEMDLRVRDEDYIKLKIN